MGLHIANKFFNLKRFAVKFILLRTNLSSLFQYKIEANLMHSKVEQVEDVLFHAIAHPMRRTILEVIATNEQGITY
jgi:hypothetical protein